MKNFLFLLVIFALPLQASFTFFSWNMKHLGRKSQNLGRMAEVLGGGLKLKNGQPLPPMDLVVLQEVNTTFTGLDSLRKLRKEITTRISENTGKKSGKDSDFFLCLATSNKPSDGEERYAMIWNEKKLHRVTEKAEEIVCEDSGDSPEKLDLTTHLADKMVREPAYAFFRDHSSQGRKKFAAFTMHAVPTAKHPADEIPLVFQSVDYHVPGDQRVIVAGDFNLSAKHAAFQKAKETFEVVFDKFPKTSLKQSEQALSEPYDNILIRNIPFDRKQQRHEVINLYDAFNLAPRTTYDQLSDHCPLMAEINLDPKL